MSGDWKPGDVAITQFGVALRVACEVEAHRGPPSEHWHFIDGSMGASGIRARPLVVIDSEDAEQVDRLADAFCHARWSHIEGSDECDPLTRTSMQAALREYAAPAPPKPDEPHGFGAVVEDTAGELWLRWEIVGRHSKPWSVAGAVKPNRSYDEVDAVRVLSPGVEADA